MAINYEKINEGNGWTTQTSLGPTNLNHMESGIKSACDTIDTDCVQATDITPIAGTDLVSGILTQNSEEFYPITQANLVKTSDGETIESKLSDMGDCLKLNFSSSSQSVNVNFDDYRFITVGVSTGNSNIQNASTLPMKAFTQMGTLYSFRNDSTYVGVTKTGENTCFVVVVNCDSAFLILTK